MIALLLLTTIVCGVISGDSEKTKPLANPPEWRDRSNKLDKAMGWEGDYKDESRLRGFVH